MAQDALGQPVLLFTDDWHLKYFMQNHDQYELTEYPPDTEELARQAVRV